MPTPRDQETEAAEHSAIVPAPSTEQTAPTGGRQAFRDLRRALTDQELNSPAVTKLLIDQLDQADGRCDELSGYVARFHEADKRAAVLQQRVLQANSFEILYGASLTGGSIVLGLVPSYWDNGATGAVLFAVGAILVGGAVVARIKGT